MEINTTEGVLHDYLVHTILQEAVDAQTTATGPDFLSIRENTRHSENYCVVSETFLSIDC